jgi:hypothetical protein
MYPNNNRGGFYGNQNNSSNNIYRPQNQNIYQNMNMNNYKPPQGPYQNNYNQNNYNQNNFYNQQQQNYGNQNQQNQNAGPKPFISGFIGRCKISSEDVQTFSKSIKEVEWTTNVNYLQAQNVPVRTKIISQGENRNDVFIPRHRFNDYYLNSNFNPNEIIAFVSEVNDTNRKAKEQGDKEKSDFLKNNFPSESADIGINDLYKKIGENRKDVIAKDSNLNGKVERLLPLIKKYE